MAEHVASFPCCVFVKLANQCMAAGYKLPELPEPAGESYQCAVEVLLPYLLSHHSRLASFEAEASSCRTRHSSRQ